MLQTIESINTAINNFVWGVPAMILILGVGIILAFKTRFIQFRKFGYAIKNSIGKLSAFCGVVIAGTGCGAGIAYLEGGQEREINHTIVNSLAIISGVVCDGAKSSCAAKIASSVEAGILGYYMFKEGNQFLSGEGIVKKGVENTINAVGKLATVGMCETDKEIIHIMLK